MRKAKKCRGKKILIVRRDKLTNTDADAKLKIDTMKIQLLRIEAK